MPGALAKLVLVKYLGGRCLTFSFSKTRHNRSRHSGECGKPEAADEKAAASRGLRARPGTLRICPLILTRRRPRIGQRTPSQ
eukprot:13076597-Alexandrium_andersonii.AAC.1